MHTISIQVDELLAQVMATGKYQTPDEALLDALRILLDRDQQMNPEEANVIAGVRRGMADAEAGRLRPADDFLRDLRQKHSSASFTSQTTPARSSSSP